MNSLLIIKNGMKIVGVKNKIEGAAFKVCGGDVIWLLKYSKNEMKIHESEGKYGKIVNNVIAFYYNSFRDSRIWNIGFCYNREDVGLVGR